MLIYPFVQRAARKPVKQGVGNLDRNHPQLRGFTHFYALTDPQIWITGIIENALENISRKKTTPVRGAGEGPAGWTADYWQCNITDNNGGLETDIDMCDGISGCTVIAEVRWKGSGTAEDNILTYWGNQNAEKKIIYRYDPSADQMEFFVRNSGGTQEAFNLDVSGTTFSAGTDFITVAARWNGDGSGSMEAWCGWDTYGLHSASVTGSTNSGTASDNPGFFREGSQSSDEGQYDVRYCAFAPVAIPDAQLKAWFTHPWRPFRRPMPFFLQSSGVESYTATIAQSL